MYGLILQVAARVSISLCQVLNYNILTGITSINNNTLKVTSTFDKKMGHNKKNIWHHDQKL